MTQYDSVSTTGSIGSSDAAAGQEFLSLRPHSIYKRTGEFYRFVRSVLSPRSAAILRGWLL